MREGAPLRGRVFIRGRLVCRTGLHIGALREYAVPGAESTVVGGIDAPVVRKPLGEKENGPGSPYIPGTSLKGKLRFLLERKLGSEETTPFDFWPVVATVGEKKEPIRIHTCEREDCPVCRLFGNVPLPDQEENGTSFPSSLYVSDLRLLPSEAGGQKGRRKGKRSETERKVEACVDRSTAHTNPREIERVPSGAKFELRLGYQVQDPDYLREDLGNLLGTLALLEDDALGGHGSRGYGAVKIFLKEIEARSGEQLSLWKVGNLEPTRKPSEGLLPAEEEEGKPLRELEGWVEEIIRHLEVFFQPVPLAGNIWTEETPAGGAVSQPPKAATEKGQKERLFLAKLAFTAPLHIGEVGIGLEGSAAHISSDILFSGLCHAWALSYGTPELENLLGRFNDGDPPFLLSSAFPYRKEDLFFPCPKIYRGWEEGAEELKEMGKKLLKDVPWLSLPLFVKWIEGSGGSLRFTEDDYQELENCKQSLKEVCQGYLLPRLRLDRVEARSNLFFCKLIQFHQDSGLFCLVRSAEEEMLERIQGALEVLGEIGLGGERSTGCGSFRLDKWEDAQTVRGLQDLLKLRVDDRAYLTLSLYHPSDPEMKGMTSAHLLGYELVERGGWVDSPELHQPVRKRPCRMFLEGSVFGKGLGGPPRGRLVDVRPSRALSQLPQLHPVYRYGFFFPVGAVPPEN